MGFFKNLLGLAVVGTAAYGVAKVAKRYQENQAIEQIAAEGDELPIVKDTSEVIGDIAKATTEVIQEASEKVLDTIWEIKERIADYRDSYYACDCCDDECCCDEECECTDECCCEGTPAEECCCEEAAPEECCCEEAPAEEVKE